MEQVEKHYSFSVQNSPRNLFASRIFLVEARGAVVNPLLKIAGNHLLFMLYDRCSQYKW